MTDKTNRQIDIMLLGEEAPKRITVDKLDEIIMDERDKVLAEQAMSTPATMAPQPTGELPMSEQDAPTSGGDNVQFYLNPYAGSEKGAYFSTFEEYEALAERLRAQNIEEWEIDWIDGDEDLRRVWEAAGGSSSGQMIIERFIEEVADGYLEDYELAALAYLMSYLGYDLVDALTKYDEVILSEQSPADYVQDYFEETMEIPSELRFYIDWEKMARDWSINGDINEFDFGSRTFTIGNASSL